MVDKPLAEMTAEELERAVEFHDYQYWQLHAPVISDEEFDLLVRRLQQLRPDSPVLTRIGGTAPQAESFRDRVVHPSPMLSLDKCYDDEKLFAWLKTTVGRTLKTAAIENDLRLPSAIREQFAPIEREDQIPPLVERLRVSVSPKVDGVAAALRYAQDGRLEVAATRGDGVAGEDFTLNARLIPGIPWQLPPQGARIEVRGEIHMKRSVFRSKYAATFPNARNLTAGSLKQKESNRAQLFDLSFLAYDLIVTGPQARVPETEELKKKQLCSLGFVPVETRFVEAAQVPDLYLQALADRDSWDFDADGIVIRLDDGALQEVLGLTAHHPRFAIAYKFQGDTGLTTLRQVEWSVARSATITPVALVEPVFLSGARVSRSTLHNIKEFRKLDLHVGDTVRMKRRGDVIPKVEENLGGGEAPFPVPESCPSCGSPALLAAPQFFVSGARFQRSGDAPQLDVLIANRTDPTALDGLFNLLESANSAARRSGDLRFKEALTWARNESDRRRELTRFLNSLPALRPPRPAVLGLLVFSPDLAASRLLFELVLSRVRSHRMEIRLLAVRHSRFESAPSPLLLELVEAGRADSAWKHLAASIPALEALLALDCRAVNGDWSDELLARTTELAYQLCDDLLVCSTPQDCRDTRLGALEHFIATIGVDGFGRKIIENLYDNGLLRNPEDFFRLEAQALVPLERMGDLLAGKLVENVRQARTMPLSTFLQALGIEELARNISTLLEREYCTLDRVLELTEADLMQHEGVAFGIAHQVIHGLRRARPAIEALRPFVVLSEPAPATSSGLPFAGLSFVFTGRMKSLQRKDAQAKVKALGGETPDDVVTDLSFLVVGDEGSPLFGQGARGSKMVKAEKYVAAGAAIRIISETDFLQMVRQAGGES